jgi:HEPN domain-containing protein
MSKVDSRIPADWVERAEKDLASAKYLLNTPEAKFIAPAAMLLQQSIEKYLKGYLLARGKSLKRTHDLGELLDDILPDSPKLARFDETCIKITEYYTEQRYPPLVASELTREEVLHSLTEAEVLIKELLRRAGL